MKFPLETISSHVQHFADQLKFDRLEQTRANFASPENQAEIGHTFFAYRLLLKRLIALSPDDTKIIADVNQSRGKPGADSLLAELGPHRQTMIQTLNEALDPQSPLYQAALTELRERMQNGQDIADAGLKPQDGDLRSDQAIWGFTQIAPEHVLAQMHFLICHFIERFMTQTYRKLEIPMAQRKDYFLTAMTDVLILENLRRGRFADIFAVWRRGKAEGGLGWISDSRLEAYQNALVREVVVNQLGITFAEMMAIYSQEDETLTEDNLIAEILEAGEGQAFDDDIFEDKVITGVIAVAGVLGPM